MSFGETTFRDLRFGVRMLRKRPGFAAVAVLTLALGIGATASVFSLIHGVLLTPPRYLKPEQVVIIEPTRIDRQPYTRGCTTAQWIEWHKATNSFQATAGYEWGFQFLILGDGSESVAGLFVTPDYFNVVGRKPLLGRQLLQSDMQTKGGKESTIILGYELWQRRFNGDTNIIGKIIRLSRRGPLTVIGVMPAGFRFLPTRIRANSPNYNVNALVDFWMPLWPPNLSSPKEDYCNMVGRLRDGVTLAQAQAELTALAGRQAHADSDFQGITAKVEPLLAELNRNGRRLLVPLFCAVMLLFLIACGNVAGLQLVRGLQRQQEYAVRLALGARRSQAFRQVVTESLLLVFVSAAAGLGLAAAIVALLKAAGGVAIPRLDAVAIGWPVLAFCVGLAMLSAVLAGLAPALRTSRLDPMLVIKSAGPSTSGAPRDRRLLSSVAMIQIVLTLNLLVGAGLLIRTMHNLARIQPGYETQNILTMSVTMPDHSKFADFHHRALTKVSTLPGVEKAAFAWGVPLTGNNVMTRVKIEGRSDSEAIKDEMAIPTRCVTSDYFEMLRLKVINGRGFRPNDAWKGPNAATNTPLYAVINEAMAKEYFANENPIGRKISLIGWFSVPAEVIGVLANAHNRSLVEAAGPEIYLSLWQADVFTKHLVVRAASDPHSLIAAIRQELHAIDPSVAVESVKTLEEIRRDSVAPQTFVMRLLVGFSLIGGALALVGIYGVGSLFVGSRTREIAIRMALGAQRHRVLWLILRHGLTLTAVGLLVGIITAAALVRVLKAFLFGVEPIDPLTFACVAILFAVVALLACYIPARRAIKTEPTNALRYE